MSEWVIVLRGFDTSEQGVLDAEQRIREALPEFPLRALTVLEWLYEDVYHGHPPLPALDHHAFAVAEHSAPLRLRASHGSATRPQ